MCAHAILSASSSSLWIHCPPSVRLSQKYEDEVSPYALEGTSAHALAEYKLKKLLGLDTKDPVSYTHLTLPTIAAECRSRWSPYH